MTKRELPFRGLPPGADLAAHADAINALGQGQRNLHECMEDGFGEVNKTAREVKTAFDQFRATNLQNQEILLAALKIDKPATSGSPAIIQPGKTVSTMSRSGLLWRVLLASGAVAGGVPLAARIIDAVWKAVIPVLLAR